MMRGRGSPLFEQRRKKKLEKEEERKKKRERKKKEEKNEREEGRRKKMREIQFSCETSLLIGFHLIESRLILNI